MSHARERGRVALTGDNGPNDFHAGNTRDIADDSIKLDIHLFQGLLHMLDMMRRIRYQHRSLPEIGSKLAYLIVGTECALQQSIGMQLLH